MGKNKKSQQSWSKTRKKEKKIFGTLYYYFKTKVDTMNCLN